MEDSSRRSDPFDYVLERLLKEEQAKLTRDVINGRTSDWGEYKFITGQIYGIQFAIEHMAEVREKLGIQKDEE